MPSSSVNPLPLAPAISLRGIRKSFGPVLANVDVCLEVHRGSIHGILGENGAGKSTAMKILYGLIEPDQGEIWIEGQAQQLRSPMEAKALGIGMVHQHFMLSEAQTVLENIVLGQEPRFPAMQCLPAAFQALNMPAARSRLQLLMTEHDFNVPLDSKVADLSVGIMQRVEILKLLYHQTRILILDEPTAVLTPQEVKRFFLQLKALAADGKTILIVTHKLQELIAVTDAISIFRSGKVIATVKTDETDADALAALMIGRRLDRVRNEQPGLRGERPLLRLKNWPLHPKSKTQKSSPRCSLELFPGEILGIAGIEGNGQLELVDLLRRPKQFKVTAADVSLELFDQDIRQWSGAEVTAAGVGCIPADRHRQGLLLDMSAIRNFVLGYHRHPDFCWGPFIRWQAVSNATKQGMEDCDVQPLNPELALRNFSGGNQQKLLIARELHHHPKLLIAMHPTRGVDIGAIQLIHRKLLALRAQGLAILLISSELDEIIALADRILVMENYRISASFSRENCDETALGLAMSGAAPAEEAIHGR